MRCIGTGYVQILLFVSVHRRERRETSSVQSGDGGLGNWGADEKLSGAGRDDSSYTKTWGYNFHMGTYLCWGEEAMRRAKEGHDN